MVPITTALFPAFAKLVRGSRKETSAKHGQEEYCLYYPTRAWSGLVVKHRLPILTAQHSFGRINEGPSAAPNIVLPYIAYLAYLPGSEHS